MPPTAAPSGVRWPRIPHLTKEHRQRAQLDYLRWRLDMYLKDYGATRSDRRKWMRQFDEVRAGTADYVAIVNQMEAIMVAHLTKQLNQIQSIYNERTD